MSADLLARLQAATGPDPDIDRAIATALGIAWSADDDGNFGGYGIMPRRVRFTELVDAALTLISPGLRWYVADGDDRSNGLPVASVFEPDAILKTGRVPRSVGATPAIAICIAALKARTDAELFNIVTGATT